MALTPDQSAQLQAAIDANPTWAAYPLTTDGYADLAAVLNSPATPDSYVWKTSVVVTDLMRSPFDWTRVDNLTVGKARIWQFMTATTVVDPSQPNVRAGFEACWSVESGDDVCRQAIYNGSQRLASSFEQILATGTGTPSDDHGIGPATMAVSGPLTALDVEIARNL